MLDGLTPQEAARRVEALRRDHVAAQQFPSVEGAGWRIAVPAGAVSRALPGLVQALDEDRAARAVSLGPPLPGEATALSLARADAARCEAVSRSLERLAGVASARVTRSLPLWPDLSLAPPTEGPRVSVVIAGREGVAVDTEAVRAVTAAALDVSAERVTVAVAPARHPEAPLGSLTRVGPWRVVAADAPSLRGTLAALWVGYMLGAAAVIVRRARRRRRGPPTTTHPQT